MQHHEFRPEKQKIKFYLSKRFIPSSISTCITVITNIPGNNTIKSTRGESKKRFEIFRIMRSLYKHSPGSQELVAPNRLSKFDREHAFSSIFRFKLQWDYIWSSFEKRFGAINS